MPILALAAMLVLGQNQDSEVRKILERFEALRATDKELALFRLDWVPTLREAKEKAAREGRPIFLLTVENEHGALYGGHC